MTHSISLSAQVMTYRNVQALRSVAALLVVIGHASGFHLFVTGSVNLQLVTYSGVDIFFVISGFIISTVATKREANAWHFLVKRASRIFPVYWVVLAVSAVASLWVAVGTPWIWQMPARPVTDYVFLLTLANRFVPQAWSLAYEIYFYAWVSFILLMPSRGFWPVLGILMLSQTGLVAAVTLRGGNPDLTVVTSGMVIQFGFGCAVAWACGRGHLRFAAVALVIGLLGFVAGAAWTQHSSILSGLPRTVTFGLGSAALLYALVSFELRGRFIFPRVMQQLGDASYSIYLWHLLILTVFVRLLPVETFMTIPSRNAYGMVCLVTVLGASTASYRFLEVPMIRLVNRLLGGARSAPRPEVVHAGGST